ncbi:helicase [Olivibacter sp. SDN3]|uniref:SF3 helicase domain-containing protein n=1 Tax=Olivibacter ginsenosidimutans TaxID=1176537 RepID=A0ABP9BD61_9SPHI|nr:DUF5906 domain-containing protein [Olivibacter sp. SDN3]QNL49658.1 helicase [Olivibacter sp. SDN3]
MATAQHRYLRIGTSFYKKVKKPLLSKDVLESLIPWTIEAIKQDHPNEWRILLKEMPKYDGFCTIPEHLDYHRDYQGFYNLYEPIIHVPKKSECETILQFIEHIFGEQYELGLDYLQLLYTHPRQRLPVLCLVSSEGNTGKTTFLNLLKAVFGNNMTFNTNADFRSNFNADWVSKLIIAIDEVLLDRREDSEKIKNLSTAKSYKAEAKGKDRFEVEFFGKIILCSNNEDNFMVIGVHETRYWVRKVCQFEQLDPDFLWKIESEIPAFLHYLLSRNLSTKNNSRMWFTPEQIATSALRKVKSHYVNKVELELYEIIREIMEAKGLNDYCLTNTHTKLLLERSGIKITRSQVRNILEGQWKLKQHPNASTFSTFLYDHNGFLLEFDGKGRYYRITQHDLDRIYEEMLTF